MKLFMTFTWFAGPSWDGRAYGLIAGWFGVSSLGLGIYLCNRNMYSSSVRECRSVIKSCKLRGFSEANEPPLEINMFETSDQIDGPLYCQGMGKVKRSIRDRAVRRFHRTRTNPLHILCFNRGDWHCVLSIIESSPMKPQLGVSVQTRTRRSWDEILYRGRLEGA
ncbi:hypothetical protein G7K_4804-t1 [Saitoella complicata NRRL Y-17804]|uniref:Uncharacterized protein n=1 Tax=Saitoella complicata (strain BCRC 22490 / CBS 7301 / JCM 7358 / NBRC 10748 / NRRL Y-17804) TaxID=698492 RepID=A0A0E9NLC2_SAICN|nr:hypothetical protein G7K_4804-t1 [Saitoella complicata NRRL Y-17804]